MYGDSSRGDLFLQGEGKTAFGSRINFGRRPDIIKNRNGACNRACN